MKKWIGTMFLATLMQTAFAQDFKNVENSLILRNYESAKKEYDKIVLKKANLDTTSEGYYWKSRIYAAYALEADTSKIPDASAKLLNNLEAYMKKDPKFDIANKNGREPFFVVYSKSAKLGETAFLDKNWKLSATEFDRALFYSDIIYSNGWGEIKQPFDTITLRFAGYSNQNAGNEEIAIKYYTRIIDANIVVDIDLYKYVLIKAADKKNKDLFDKYYAKCLMNFPEEKWYEFKLDYVQKNLNIDEKINYYNNVIEEGKANEYEHQTYGEMFMLAKNDEDITPEKESKIYSIALNAFKNAYNLNKNNFLASFNIGINYYNQYGIVEEKLSKSRKNIQILNANKPTDPVKKKNYEIKIKPQIDSIKRVNQLIETDLLQKLDSSILWIEISYNIIASKETLTRQEANLGSRAVDYLATFYLAKADKAKGKDQKLVEEMEKNYNKYDLLHDSFEVKLGATKKIVTKLLGKPNNIVSSSPKSNSIELYIYNKQEIGFDKNGLVDYINDIK